MPLASARQQHPEIKKENKAGHSSERAVEGHDSGRGMKRPLRAHPAARFLFPRVRTRNHKRRAPRGALVFPVYNANHPSLPTNQTREVTERIEVIFGHRRYDGDRKRSQLLSRAGPCFEYTSFVLGSPSEAPAVTLNMPPPLLCSIWNCEKKLRQ